MFDKLNADYALEAHKGNTYTYEAFSLSFSAVLDQCLPIKQATRKDLKFKSKPWITLSIKKSIKLKNNMYKSIYKSKNESEIQHLKHYSNLLTRVKKAAKLSYYQQELEKNEYYLRKLWSNINKL